MEGLCLGNITVVWVPYGYAPDIYKEHKVFKSVSLLEYKQCYSVTDKFKPFRTKPVRFVRTPILSALIILARQVQMFVTGLVTILSY